MLIKEATDIHAASAVAAAGYGLTSFPLSQIAAAISILLSLVYMWGALPRWWKTTAAFLRGVRKGDMTEWRKLGDQPMQEKED